MVDREERNTLAQNLRWLVAGRITNDEFDDAEPADCRDRAVNQIWQFGWALYSDTHPYRLKGRHKVSSDIRKRVARGILFLRSDYEYKWPDIPDSFWRQFLPFGVGVFGLLISSVMWLLGIQSYSIVMSASFVLLLLWQLSVFFINFEDPKAWRDFEKFGEIAYWPFLRKVDFDDATQTCHLLGKPGRQSTQQ